MNRNQLVRVHYEIRFESRWVSYAGFFAGLSIFLLCVAFFGFGSTEGAGNVFCVCILPLVLLTVFGILLQGFKVKAVRIYGVIGVLYCVCMILRAFSVPGTFLAVVWYSLTAVVLLVCAFGILPIKVLTAVMFLIPVVYRLAVVDGDLYFATKDYKGFIWEAAALCGLCAFSMFAMCLKGNPVGKDRRLASEGAIR